MFTSTSIMAGDRLEHLSSLSIRWLKEKQRSPIEKSFRVKCFFFFFANYNWSRQRTNERTRWLLRLLLLMQFFFSANKNHLLKRLHLTLSPPPSLSLSLFSSLYLNLLDHLERRRGALPKLVAQNAPFCCSTRRARHKREEAVKDNKWEIKTCTTCAREPPRKPSP